jgi:hypothetical protein
VSVTDDGGGKATVGVSATDTDTSDHAQLTNVTSGQHHTKTTSTDLENGGSDPLNVGGLPGDLADAQDPKTHDHAGQSISPQSTDTEELSVTETYLGRLADTPTDSEIGTGNVALYFKENDNTLYKRPYGGTETAIGGSGGSSPWSDSDGDNLYEQDKNGIEVPTAKAQEFSAEFPSGRQRTTDPLVHTDHTDETTAISFDSGALSTYDYYIVDGHFSDTNSNVNGLTCTINNKTSSDYSYTTRNETKLSTTGGATEWLVHDAFGGAGNIVSFRLRITGQSRSGDTFTPAISADVTANPEQPHLVDGRFKVGETSVDSIQLTSQDPAVGPVTISGVMLCPIASLITATERGRWRTRAAL